MIDQETLVWRDVRAIVRGDISHRKGWKPSEVAPSAIGEHLKGEAEELIEAIASGDRDHTVEELSDVYNCVLHLAVHLGLTLNDLEAKADEKLRLRFPAFGEQADSLPSDGVLAFAYAVPIAGTNGREVLKIERTSYDAQDTWAIRYQGFRMSRSGKLGYEPTNSSKTDRYIRSHTFTLAEARPIAERLASRGSDGIHDAYSA